MDKNDAMNRMKEKHINGVGEWVVATVILKV